MGSFRTFIIYALKERLISAPCFPDRVKHHAVINVCEPVFERWLVRQTFACRRGLGLRVAIAEKNTLISSGGVWWNLTRSISGDSGTLAPLQLRSFGPPGPLREPVWKDQVESNSLRRCVRFVSDSFSFLKADEHSSEGSGHSRVSPIRSKLRR